MKSLRDEIRTDVRDTENGFDFIVSEANDFIRASRGFHRGTAAISLKYERFIIWPKLFFNVGRGKYDLQFHLYDITNRINRDTAHRVNDVGRPRRFLPKNGVSTSSIAQDGQQSQYTKQQITICRDNDASVLHVCKWYLASKLIVCFFREYP